MLWTLDSEVRFYFDHYGDNYPALNKKFVFLSISATLKQHEYFELSV